MGDRIGFPLMIRPSFILGGAGTGIAHRTGRSWPGWRPRAWPPAPSARSSSSGRSPGGRSTSSRSCATGRTTASSSAPSRTSTPWASTPVTRSRWPRPRHLSDVEYQAMRDDAFACIRRVGVETGGSNIQFAVDPRTGRRLVIEMNPRVSRSSALASKATGFPIAKIAARLAVGYTLDEIPNDITGATPASFEPTIDYVVTKIPRWAFEKLPGVTDRLGTRMQSVGEVMAIGRTFPESLQKAHPVARAGPERPERRPGRIGLRPDRRRRAGGPVVRAHAGTASSSSRRRCAAASAPTRWPPPPVSTPGSSTSWPPSPRRACTSRPWPTGARCGPVGVDGPRHLAGRQAARFLRRADRLSHGRDRRRTYARRAWPHGVRATFKTVDTCGAEFEAATPYHYATYEDEDEVRPATRPRVVILGSGPNRIGQGIEFDYCCVHASMALRDAGLRDGDGQLQPRDRLDRLRHLRPPLLRTARRPKTWPTSSTPRWPPAPAPVARPSSVSS